MNRQGNAQDMQRMEMKRDRLEGERDVDEAQQDGCWFVFVRSGTIMLRMAQCHLRILVGVRNSPAPPAGFVANLTLLQPLLMHAAVRAYRCRQP